eukprot:4697153-Pyramimonas_sp.AAC.1
MRNTKRRGGRKEAGCGGLRSMGMSMEGRKEGEPHRVRGPLERGEEPEEARGQGQGRPCARGATGGPPGRRLGRRWTGGNCFGRGGGVRDPRGACRFR